MVFGAERIQPAGVAVGGNAGHDECGFVGGGEPWTDAVGSRDGQFPGRRVVRVPDAGPGKRGVAG